MLRHGYRGRGSSRPGGRTPQPCGPRPKVQVVVLAVQVSDGAHLLDPDTDDLVGGGGFRFVPPVPLVPLLAASGGGGTGGPQGGRRNPCVDGVESVPRKCAPTSCSLNLHRCIHLTAASISASVGVV